VIAYVGIALAVAVLIIVMSVMNGFRAELLSRILGFNGHVFVTSAPAAGLDPAALAQRLSGLPGVVQVAQVLEGQVMAVGDGQVAGAVVRGVSRKDLLATRLVSGNVTPGGLDGWGEGDFVDSIGNIAGDDRESGWNEGGLEGEDASPSDEYEGDEGGLEGEDAPSPSNEYVGHEDGHEGEDAPSPSSEHEGPWDQYEGDEGGHVEEVASPSNEYKGLWDEHEGSWDEYEGDEGSLEGEDAPSPSNEYKGSWDEYEGDHAREGSWNEYEGGHEDEGAPWGEHESPCTAHNFYDRMASGIASGRWPTLSDVRRLLDDCGRTAFISSKPTALRYQPKYPGERSPNNAMSGQYFSFDLVVMMSRIVPRCGVCHIRFYRLIGNGDSAIDGNWLHDFNPDTPRV
jgi:hypothetical protein